LLIWATQIGSKDVRKRAYDEAFGQVEEVLKTTTKDMEDFKKA